jgi:hypothetical protein
MRRLLLARFRFAWLPGRFLEPAKPVKVLFPRDLSSSPLPPAPAEEPLQDWESLWIDLGGEG